MHRMEEKPMVQELCSYMRECKNTCIEKASRKAKLSDYGIWKDIPEPEFEKTKDVMEQARKGIKARI